VVSIAPYASRGLRKMGGHLLATAPGDEAAALDQLVSHADHGLDATGVILVGERLATVPGALTAAARVARTTGARLAWVPRRAGDRGAVEAGCLPGLLPGGRPVADAGARVDAATTWGVEHLPEQVGRDADAIVAALRSGELGGLVVGGVDPDDTADPAATRAAIGAASFVVALELRETDVTRAADVVFPVAPVSDKAGTFVTWDGRPREFPAVFEDPRSLPDLRVLAGIAEELAALGRGRPLGFRTVVEARAEMRDLGPWDGERAVLGDAAAAPPQESSAVLRLATWKQMVDNGSMQDGEKYLRATGRRAVARVSPATYASLHESVRDGGVVVGDRGRMSLPVEPTEGMVDGVVWVPGNSGNLGVLAVASPGSTVTLKGAAE
jgi:NADH-quinone oxidoreductase subunit G